MLMTVIDLNKPSEYIFDMVYLTNEFSKINTFTVGAYKLFFMDNCQMAFM